MQTNYLSNVSDIVQIISSIFVVIGGFIAIWQYCLNVKSTKSAMQKDLELRQTEIYQRDRYKITKAIELAGYYKDHILPLARELRKIYTSTGIFEILQTIKTESMKEFDIIELEQILSQAQIQQIKVLGTKYHVDTALKEEGIAYALDERYHSNNTSNSTFLDERYNNTKTNNSTFTETNESDLSDADTPASRYAQAMIQTLNNLEYFSMYFVHNVAEHTVVYQSLHMTFLEIVRILYYDISSANVNGEKKYYINTITLFKKWSSMAAEQRNKEIKIMRSAVNMGPILEKNEKIGLTE